MGGNSEASYFQAAVSCSFATKFADNKEEEEKWIERARNGPTKRIARSFVHSTLGYFYIPIVIYLLYRNGMTSERWTSARNLSIVYVYRYRKLYWCTYNLVRNVGVREKRDYREQRQN